MARVSAGSVGRPASHGRLFEAPWSIGANGLLTAQGEPTLWRAEAAAICGLTQEGPACTVRQYGTKLVGVVSARRAPRSVSPHPTGPSSPMKKRIVFPELRQVRHQMARTTRASASTSPERL